MDSLKNILDIQNPIAVKIAITVVIAASLIYWYVAYKYSYWSRRGINGPPVVPFIGNMVPVSKPLPLMQVENMKKYGKFFGMYRGMQPFLSIADPVVIKRILVKDFHIFRNRIEPLIRQRILEQNLVATRDEKWKRIRSILTPMFTTSKLKNMESLMEQCVSSLINALDKAAEKNESFPVHDVMGNFTMDVIAKCAFATDTDAHNEVDNVFVKNARGFFQFRLLRTLILPIVPDFMQKALQKIGLLRFEEVDFFTETSFYLINQRKQNPSIHHQDMLQLMVKAEHGKEDNFDKADMFDAHHVNVGHEELENEKKILQEIIGSKTLNEEEIAAQTMIFFLAGYETTASTLTFCMYELATNPDVQQKLYEEIRTVVDNGEPLDYNHVMTLPYLDAVIAETLRKHPPILVLNRKASETYHIAECNHTLEKGDDVFIPVYAIHHSREFYENPEQFDPERFMPENRDKIIPYTYLPFGGGPRNCIGMRFAMSEAKLGLAKIINRFHIDRTNKTTEKIQVVKSFFIMKTEPIFVGVRHRN